MNLRAVFKLISFLLMVVGLAMAAIAGLLSVFSAVPFMTGLWVYPSVLGVEIPLSSVMLFDTGVYLVVVGSITSMERMVSGFCSRLVWRVKRACSYTPRRKESPVAV